MPRLRTLIAFLTLNFGALFLGGLFTSSGVKSVWYSDLTQAPWTPPGAVFGIAWTSIMICFSLYMSALYHSKSNRKKILGLFAVQWILNVSWNPVFFHFHFIGFALGIITFLTVTIAFFLIYFTNHNRTAKLYILPYLTWLILASSLNAFILINN